MGLGNPNLGANPDFVVKPLVALAVFIEVPTRKWRIRYRFGLYGFEISFLGEVLKSFWDLELDI